MAKRDKNRAEMVRAEGCYRIYKGGLEVQANQLRSPTKTFAAQVCRVEEFGRAYLIYFGQILPPTLRLCSIIAVQLNDAALRDFQQTLVPSFRASVTRLAGERPPEELTISDEELQNIPRERTAAFTATIGRVVVSNIGSQIDWYELSPRQIHLLSTTAETVDPPSPVVTVSLSNSLLERMIELIDDRLGPPSVEEQEATAESGGA